jgi:hypothetical protein
MPFLFSLRGMEAGGERKRQGSKGRAATSPALVSPFGIPLPRRPLSKEWPKGETHPHFGEKGKVVLAFVVPGGVAQTLVVCPLGHSLCSWLFSPHRRPGEGRGGPSGRTVPARGKGHVEALGFSPEKTGPESQRPCDLSPAHPLFAFDRERQSRLRFGSLRQICRPIRPQGLPEPVAPRTGKQQTKKTARAKGKGRKLGGLVVLGGVECIAIWL